MLRKSGSVLLIAGLLFGLRPQAILSQESTDEAAIRHVLADYVSGWREADVERLAGVLAQEATAESGEEELRSMTFDDVLERRRPQPHYGLEWDVLALDVVDRKVAVAKLDISRSGGSYVDFLVLYKIAGEWRIVNKTFAVRSN
jgi:hypothetical protein